MILKPHFTRFRISEVSQFIKDIYSILFKYPALQAEVADYVNAMNTNGQELSKAHSAEQGSPISKEIKELDRRRDRSISGIRQYAESLTYHFRDDIYTAANLVLSSIDKYGNNLANLNYESETDVIANIVNSWDKDASLKAAIAAINLGEWAMELQTANSSMNQKFLDRVQESAQSTKIKALLLRKEAIANFREVVSNIEARAILSKTGEYVPLINELNVLVNKYNALVDARKSSLMEDDAVQQIADSEKKL